MEKLTFTDKMIEAIKTKKSILNVGLDPQMKFMPPPLIKWVMNTWGTTEKRNGKEVRVLTSEGVGQLYWRFNQKIIRAIEPFAISVKPQIAFYEAYGYWGLWAFEETIKYAGEKGLLRITDAKRGDGGDTARAYADGHLGEVSFPVLKDGVLEFESIPSSIRTDALTIHAWIGDSCVSPFVAAAKKYGTGIFVVVKTSFDPDSKVEQTATLAGGPMWRALAQMVEEWGSGTEGKYGYRNVGVVMGATKPDDAPEMKAILPRAWKLIPGYGAQGGGADGAVVVINDDGFGGVVNSSRAVIAAWQKGQFQCEPEKFAEAAANAAEFSRDDLNAALKRAGKMNW
jgi:orotidine-5'-phosphate decarboxylase